MSQSFQDSRGTDPLVQIHTHIKSLDRLPNSSEVLQSCSENINTLTQHWNIRAEGDQVKYISGSFTSYRIAVKCYLISRHWYFLPPGTSDKARLDFGPNRSNRRGILASSHPDMPK